ncbi:MULTISPECIES: hypothetical protein [Bradyrhizobium]|uniref:hypothetical protein n=1 Tax=Bradyrhizobium TaxID=374 RepID=UPI000B16BC22|nr:MULTISPECIES: hypothetical protein [Bradyrhizobium]
MSDHRIVAQEATNRLTGDPAGIAECLVRAHPCLQHVRALLQKTREELMKADFVEF